MIKFKTSILASALGLAIVTTPLYAFQAEVAAPAKETPATKIKTPEQVKADKETEAKKEADKKEKEALDKMRSEMSKLTTNYSLLMQRQKNENLQQELQKQKWAAEAAFKAAQLKQQFANDNHQLQVDAQKEKINSAKLKAKLASLREEAAAIGAETAVLSAKAANENIKRSQEIAKINNQSTLELAKIGAQNKLELAQLKKKYELQLAQIATEDKWRATKNKNKNVVTKDIQYPINPLKDGTLRISDRRIPLSGPIAGGSADYITKRIHFYNNISKTKPIFLVIDNCPGGSVMEGFRIVTAMQRSKAPIHVVVKSFAASMAAAITTLADHSYCYPNAIILHHQMSSGMRGNMTQQKESLENGYEWERRLSHPIAKKMGVTQEEFRALMYKNNSDGDWAEFGDEAKKLKWVNDVVAEIREESIGSKPDGTAPRSFMFQAKEQTDALGNRYIQLPRIDSVDHWFLHNPDKYYRK